MSKTSSVRFRDECHAAAAKEAAEIAAEVAVALALTLLQRGNKGKAAVRSIVVPKSASIAQKTHQQDKYVAFLFF